jgi:hypothetical protein
MGATVTISSFFTPSLLLGSSKMVLWIPVPVIKKTRNAFLCVFSLFILIFIFCTATHHNALCKEHFPSTNTICARQSHSSPQYAVAQMLNDYLVPASRSKSLHKSPPSLLVGCDHNSCCNILVVFLVLHSPQKRGMGVLAVHSLLY